MGAVLSVCLFAFLPLKAEDGHRLWLRYDTLNHAKVNIVNVNGKAKRLGRTAGRTAAYKKAIVTLTENSKTIEFFESL